MARPPRYAPLLPLPAQPYRLGSPGPRRAPGHESASGRSAVRGDWTEPVQLDGQAVAGFRYGVDLFNAACWWEAHEAWEALWMQAQRGSGLALLMQGLILAAASQLHAAAGRPQACARLAARAAERLRAAQARSGDPSPLGLAVGAVLEDLYRAARSAGATDSAAEPLCLWIGARSGDAP